MNIRSFPFRVFVLIFSVSLLYATSPSSKQIPRPVKTGYTTKTSEDRTPSRARPLAPYDTFVVAEFDFENPVTHGPDPQGWVPIDMTVQDGTFFHVASFNVPTGGELQAIWCGALPASEQPLCTYQFLPGYGNDWDQRFTSATFARSGEASLTYTINYDTEPGYDFVYVQYLDTLDNWIDLKYYEGQTTDVLDTLIIPAEASPDSIRVRFQFVSDGLYSDEDGQWDTAAGACQIDNIVLSDTAGIINSQNFEGEADGTTVTLDGNWTASVPIPFGSFASLSSGLTLKQDDPCNINASHMWTFLNGSTAYGCADQGLENELVIPFQNERGQEFHAGIQSPIIDLTRDI